MLYNYFLNIKNIYLSLLLLVFNLSLISQELSKEKNIDSSFSLYTKKYQETVYTHLNKSTYIKGETIGFTSYILNKKNKKLSKLTKNLYCVITDSDNKIIKQQLVKVENGVANSTFNVDSLFTTGSYTFKAYTNWMLNFNQQNFYIETFKVLDPQKNEFINKKEISSTIDAQFLPEGGHILNNAINTIGVVIKDRFGYGIPNISGKVIDENNDLITSFKANKLGIGRFSFFTKNNKDYRVVISFNGKKEVFRFSEKIELTGILLKTKEIKNEILISLVTNKTTLKNFTNKNYKVTVHNGSKISSLNFKFNDELSITKKINLNKLNSGINIFTLFDENNVPISERLFFNYNGISIVKNSVAELLEKQDSLSIKLSYKPKLAYTFNNVSASVLPYKTKSYVKNSSMISQALIQPYIKGTFENGSYYFLNINKEKKYHLDNLLLTQGWSSYNWSEIFNFTPNYSNNFEQGITLKINNINNKKGNGILIHSLSNRNSEIFNLKEDTRSISSENFFPINKEKLYVSEIRNKGKLLKPSLYIQFSPNNIPVLSKKHSSLNLRPATFATENIVDNSLLKSISNVQELDEIAVKVNLRKERIEKIKNTSFGKVYFFNDKNRNNFMTLAQFINMKGFIANDNDNTASLQVRPIMLNTVNSNKAPAFFINNIQITNMASLYMFFLDNVDYIEIDKLGYGAGVRGGAGVIKIFTNNGEFSERFLRETVKEFDFPITFEKSRKFYTPKYKNNNSSFYRNYGVIDWFPKKQMNKDGTITLKIKKPLKNFVLFIEGITDSGEFIFEEKKIIIE